jgi:hypothetical protein
MGALAGNSIEVSPELLEADLGSIVEHRYNGVRADESRPSQRCEFAHGDPVTGDDKRLSAVQLAHDLSAVVSQLSLTDLAGHR